MKRVLLLLVLASSRWTLACDMERALSETHFVIDPGFSAVKLESKKDLTQFEVSRCQEGTKYVLVNPNPIYYQDDTARRESVSGQLISTVNNCSIKSEIEYTKVSTEKTQSLLSSRVQFLNSCLRINVSEMKNQKLSLHASSTNCKLEPKAGVANVYQLSGQQCLIAVNPGSRLQFSTEIDSNCLGASLATQNITAQDVEAVIKLWPVAEEKGQLKVESPFGSRYVRYSVLPEKGLLPRVESEYTQQRSYVGIYSVNVDPGSIQMYSMGAQQSAINVSFLVQNLAQDSCVGSRCASVSNFTSVISGQLNLYKLSGKGREHISEWAHSVKVPSQFSGFADIKPENNMGTLPGGTLVAPIGLSPNDEFEITAEFFEPREHMDDISRSQSYSSSGSAYQGVSDEGNVQSLPSLPEIGRLNGLKKLAQLPSVQLGRQTMVDFIDKMNMKGQWTHRYEKVCDAKNQNCFRFNGADSAFINLSIRFKLGANKEIIPLQVTKKSAVFGDYKKQIQELPRKVCE